LTKFFETVYSLLKVAENPFDYDLRADLFVQHYLAVFAVCPSSSGIGSSWAGYNQCSEQKSSLYYHINNGG